MGSARPGDQDLPCCRIPTCAWLAVDVRTRHRGAACGLAEPVSGNVARRHARFAASAGVAQARARARASHLEGRSRMRKSSGWIRCTARMPSSFSAASIFSKSCSAVVRWNRTGPETTTPPHGSLARYLTRPPTVSSTMHAPSNASATFTTGSPPCRPRDLDGDRRLGEAALGDRERDLLPERLRRGGGE
mmetsp:Transcript_65755/g.181582  ORF Transcript_65755/g.181582 Transcript_65755/m.181582 type:complete len:190 (+) Transcript_65755:123-692(+)